MHYIVCTTNFKNLVKFVVTQILKSNKKTRLTSSYVQPPETGMCQELICI